MYPLEKEKCQEHTIKRQDRKYDLAKEISSRELMNLNHEGQRDGVLSTPNVINIIQWAPPTRGAMHF